MANSESLPSPVGMICACVPEDEAERLRALRSLDLLDTAPSESFDRVTRLAAVALGVPIVLVSLVDEQRQWFKSRFGIDEVETPRDISFCAHAVFDRMPLVVPDATRDIRFAGNPLVTGALHLRAYMGVPIVTRGDYVIGTLCVIDTHPRTFSDTDLKTLLDFTKLLEEALPDPALERDVREAVQLFREVTNHVPALIGYWSSALRCEFANDIYREWFGKNPEDIVGTHMAEVLGEQVFKIAEPRARLVLQGHAQHFENLIVKPDGAEVCIDTRYVPDVSGTVVRGFYVLATDITEAHDTRKKLEATNLKLRTDSVTDFLTGLSNRRVFSERSEAAAKRFHKHGEVYGLILLDLDNFKLINDVHGHDRGDDVLRAVGRLLKCELRSHRDVAARLGGEEFAVLCFGELDDNVLRCVAERLRSRINKETIQACETTFPFTGSFGLALSDAQDSDWKTIYARADAALYKAKAAGKNCVVFGAPVALPAEQTPIEATGEFRTLSAIQA